MKKTLLSIVAISMLSFQLIAQKWVSTSVQNKNVILEEFTGIHCGYCPDGHRLANTMVDANPGRVFLINIHSGGYAVPKAGEPDLRTSAGTAIDGSAKVTGYPSGSLNRATVPWGQSRNLWSSQATTIIGQTSPLNVYVKSFANFTTRELTTEVEVYYTGNAAQTSNYLTIALTQDDILGPQSDYGNFNPTNWVDGKYKHNHVLRQLITAGNFGELIDKTTKGSYFYKKFVTAIPANYINIPAVLYKMSVVAFVSETAAGSKIISGSSAPVDFDANLKTDLGLTDITVKPTSYCLTTISPKIEVTNNLDQTITTFDVSCFINKTEYKKTFNGSLAKGQKIVLDWGSIPFNPSGTYSIKMVGFKNVNNGLLYDMVSSNDGSNFSSFGFKTKAFTTYKDGFETGAVAANSALDLSVNPNVKVLVGSAPKYGVYGSTSALLFYLHEFWKVAGKPGHLLIGEADLSAFGDPGVSYYYAYSDGASGGTAPTIALSVSEDCGVTWKSINTVTCKETGQPTTSGNIYDPKSGEYMHVVTPLSAYKNKNVLIRITGTPGTHGNALLIDDIQIGSSAKLSVSNKFANNAHVSIYPNPLTDIAQVDYELAKPSAVNFNVYNALYQLVYSRNLDQQASGSHEEAFDFSTLNSGVYTLTISSGESVSTKMFIKK